MTTPTDQRMPHLLRMLALALSIGCGAVAVAQNAPNQDPADRGGMTGTFSRADVEKLGGAKDGAGDASHETAAARARARTQAARIAKSVGLDCEVVDARLLVEGSVTVDGHDVPTSVHEVACAAGLGYLLEAQGSDKTLVISCVAAESARAADAAKGKEPGYFCALPKNRDVWAGVAALLESAGNRCTVRDLRWVGRSATTGTEYAEIACQDGKGYVLGTAVPGTPAKTTVLGCADAARRGIKCRLSDAPPPADAPAGLQVYKDALARNGVRCEIAQLRLVGQEDHLKRYVVEYLCAGQSSAMVAFVPLAGNSNPYEAIDCSAAALDRGVACVLAPPR